MSAQPALTSSSHPTPADGLGSSRLSDDPRVLPRLLTTANDEGCAADCSHLKAPEEALVVDVRGSLTPAQIVERKLIKLFEGAGLPIRHRLPSGSWKARQAQ